MRSEVLASSARPAKARAGSIPSDDRGRGRGRRVALRERPARDAALLAPLDTDVPNDRGLRMGRRAAARASERGRDPPLGRVLHDRGARSIKDAAWEFVEFALGVEGQRIVAKTGPDRAVADRGLALARRSSTRPLPPRARRSSSTRSRRSVVCRPISTWPEIEDAAEGSSRTGSTSASRPRRSRGSSSG